MSTPSATRFRFHWGHAITLVFVAWAALMFSFLASAITGGTDSLKEEKPYEKGLAYEQRIERLRLTALASEKVEFSFDPASRAITLTGPEGAVGQLSFSRPNDARRDFVVPIRLEGVTRLVVPLPAVPGGRWRTELSYRWQRVDYLAEGELYIPAQ